MEQLGAVLWGFTDSADSLFAENDEKHVFEHIKAGLVDAQDLSALVDKVNIVEESTRLEICFGFGWTNCIF